MDLIYHILSNPVLTALSAFAATLLFAWMLCSLRYLIKGSAARRRVGDEFVFECSCCHKVSVETVRSADDLEAEFRKNFPGVEYSKDAPAVCTACARKLHPHGTFHEEP